MYEVIHKGNGPIKDFKLTWNNEWEPYQFKYKWSAAFAIWQIRFACRYFGVPIHEYEIVKVEE